MTKSFYSDSLGYPRTDETKWRLRTTELGAQRWEYLEKDDPADKQNICTKYHLDTQDFPRKELPKPTRVSESLTNTADFFSFIQDDNGIWPCFYKGPMFMTIGYIAVCYFTKNMPPEHIKHEIIRYIINTSHPVDGGWGLHEVDKSTCFGTSMNYVILRLLGVPKDHPVCERARKTLHRLGGALYNPHWGKAWLSVLNLYKWEGVNPAPSELFALPYALPIHPMKWWVHTRAIYIALGYLSSAEVQCECDPLIEEIRSEIYVKPYDKIDFSKNRNSVCGVDLYYPHTKILDFANSILVKYEKYIRPKSVLKYSNKKAYDLILKELQNTEYLCIAPVNAAFICITLFVEEGGNNSQNFQKAFDRMSEELFLGPIGMSVMGTNGTQVWDTAFAVQYYFAAGIAELPQYHDTIVKSFKFLIRSQFTEECVEGSFRDKRKGAWPFSTKEQGYTVSDCTAEAMKAIIMVMNSDSFKDVHHLYDVKRLEDAIDVLLSLQNVGSFHFGSYATYESIKATPLLELINPAEVFGNIMVEYPYVECTDSSVLGLTYFVKNYDYRKRDIQLSIDRAIKYICNSQEPDGSWYGSWGICYTYAGMFALESLHHVNCNYRNNEYVKKGCDFLVSRQLEDGGWGESMKSSEMHTYISTPESLVVQTSWVVIGLILADYPDQEVIYKGIELIISRQKSSGEFAFESIEGVFNHSCAIEYPNYKFLFTIKALGLYIKKYGDKSLN
ncbi:unnamed protein product [[Candida] boidinii]|uniref:Terpene cyclase/mutase family member n=1 Tax=Candida boidinii TaxID=5477 RepID=A0A9W6WEK8_CANBO|nr:unnamed protein product [[Candida] boidinii]